MYRFSGHGNQSWPSSPESPWQIPSGEQRFSGIFIYDSEKPLDPVTVFNVNVGGVAIELESYAPVAQDKRLIFGRGSSYVVSDAFAGYASALISFHDSDSSTLDAGMFPTALSFADFDNIAFQLSAHHNLCAIATPVGGVCPQAYQSDLHFMGDVTQLEAVPEPSAAMLVTIGVSIVLVSYAGRRRKHAAEVAISQ